MLEDVTGIFITKQATPRSYRSATGEYGALGGIRTHDLSLRRAALYPAELQAHCAVARSAGCETDR